MRDEDVDKAWILYHGIKRSNVILDMERDEIRIRNFKKNQKSIRYKAGSKIQHTVISQRLVLWFRCNGKMDGSHQIK